MKKKILVIDDEEHILELLKINLEFSGYDTYVYDTGKDALEIIEKINPDLILLDLMLKRLEQPREMGEMTLKDFVVKE